MNRTGPGIRNKTKWTGDEDGVGQAVALNFCMGGSFPGACPLTGAARSKSWGCTGGLGKSRLYRMTLVTVSTMELKHHTRETILSSGWLRDNYEHLVLHKMLEQCIKQVEKMM